MNMSPESFERFGKMSPDRLRAKLAKIQAILDGPDLRADREGFIVTSLGPMKGFYPGLRYRETPTTFVTDSELRLAILRLLPRVGRAQPPHGTRRDAYLQTPRRPPATVDG